MAMSEGTVGNLRSGMETSGAGAGAGGGMDYDVADDDDRWMG